GVQGARAFVWADLDNDGAADAALLDSEGRLFVFLNQRSGKFEKREAPDAEARYVALAVAHLDDDGPVDLAALTQDGKLMSLSLADKGWESKHLAMLGKQLPLKLGETRVQAIDPAR